MSHPASASVRFETNVRMDANPGKEAEAATVFDAFPGENGRETHLSGKVAAALMEQAPDLFTGAPVIEKADVLVSKLPA